MNVMWTTLSTACAVLIITLASSCQNLQDARPPERVETLTIFPVTAMGGQHENFGEVVGLLLEKQGYRGLEMAGTMFQPDADADFNTTAAAFGRFVAEHPIATEYALYCEFRGTPGEGVSGLRTVVVDRNGEVFWTDVQEPGDRDFDRIRPSNPMTCCMLASERVGPLLAAADEDEVAEEGPLTRLVSRRSGVPEKSEFEEMKARTEVLARTAGAATVVVYPVRVGDGTQRQAAEQLAAMLSDRELCRARVAEEALWFEVQHDSNEQIVLWNMAKAFRSRMQKSPPAADYALYADYIIAPSGEVWAVHWVVCDRAGDFVIVDYQNNHHRDFEAIAPESVEDCNRLAARRLAGYLK